MKITEMLLTPSLYNRQQTKINVTKIAVHYVGNPNSTALANRNYFESLSKSRTTKASSHYIIGLQGEIIRCIPEKEQSICTNSANPYSISIECCHPDTTGKFKETTYNALIELCADICRRYNLNPLADIIRHYDVTGKICPKWFVDNPKEWEVFRNKVNVAIEMTFEEALKIVAEKVDTSYKFWLGKRDIDPSFPALIIKIAKSYGGK
ncbi:N-acetylmuramoyl-L-alanine amidase [Ruminiclostridium sufflavum DSM 19573]|uniref:N-acetylmuramoyl-L-alanine amidase n=1 Tax=Ruminiclostridium sufflavum DSM 19573 TaxID=1121337 RepID=A0A318XLK7_9FIRM|nr:peptidoglycan recognition family protein [Ruminiclostridium sufflavum]PYG88508.1 N-acetylmuramoyl-L-alanine amidase [Ruminiclostridium sufflavum DSM 19573]